MKKHKKRTLRGYQTALGLALRREKMLKERLETKASEMVQTERALVYANDTIRNLRSVIGEPYPMERNGKYRRECLAVSLDDREFGPIPPIHIHIKPKGSVWEFSQHEKGYIFELHIPEGESLHRNTSRVIHNSLHQLVDFVERGEK